MGIRRRFQRLLLHGRPSAAAASGSEAARDCQQRSRHQCCCFEQQQPAVSSTTAAVATIAQWPQLGRRGPVFGCHHPLLQQQQQQQHRLQQNQKCPPVSERRRGNHYASFSASSSSSSTASSASSSSAAGCPLPQGGGCRCRCSQEAAPPAVPWRPAKLNFVRLESADASSSACSVAELSLTAASATPAMAASAAVYEEISEPLYDRVAASTTVVDTDIDAAAADEHDYDDDDFDRRYWRYSSLPRQHRRHHRGGSREEPQPLGQPALQQQAQAQQQLPLGCTLVDWRGVKCTSF